MMTKTDSDAFAQWFNPDDTKNYRDCWEAACAHARKTVEPPRRIMEECARDTAVDTLLDMGYDWFGGHRWKPPVAPQEVDSIQRLRSYELTIPEETK